LDELIIQVLSGDADPSATERVQHWRAESAENEAHFGTLARVWSLTEPVDVREAGQPVETAIILAAAEQRRRSEDRTAVIPIGTRSRRFDLGSTVMRWGAALAAGIAAVAVGIGTGLFTPGPRPVASYLAQADVPSTVSLGDGSFVKLAPGSSLEVWDSEAERTVTLSGRGFFAVAHEAERPFIVRSGDTETRVLGTRFEVSETSDGVRTVVVDGRVALSNAQGAVEVPAGSLGQAGVGVAPTSETPDDIYALLDWPTGLMLFQGTPLGRVAQEVGRRYGQVVEVRGETLQALRISGTFEEERFEEVVLVRTLMGRCGNRGWNPLATKRLLSA
jgi:transmembrane sensor